MKKQPEKIKVHSDKVEMLPVDALKPYGKNARTHSPAQIQNLANLIKAQGFTSPILIDDKLVLISGHGRLAAAQSIGMKEVPCVRVKGLSAAAVRAMRLSDNFIATESAWDVTIAGEELEALKSSGIDLVGLGFESFAEELLPSGGEDLEPTERTGTRVNQTIIQFNIVFEDEEQQAAWFAFMRKLKEKYPAEASLAARLIKFLEKAKV